MYDEFARDPVLGDCFPCTRTLLYYCMIMPSSTAVVERSFSMMSNILTKKRNRLTQCNLDATMRICHQNRPLTDEDLEALVDLFKGRKNRKIKL